MRCCYGLITFLKFFLLIFSISRVSKSSRAKSGTILLVAKYEVLCWVGKEYFFSSLSIIFVFHPLVVVSYLRVTLALPLHSL